MKRGPVAQLVEQFPFKEWVTSSNLVGLTKIMTKNRFFFVQCKNCKCDIKISPNVYRSKQKQICDICLTETFKKFKKKTKYP